MTRSAFNRDSQKIVDGIVKVFGEQKPPLTVRQVYYQLASVGLVPLSKNGYRQAQRLLLRVREEGIIPWDDFADRTREVEQRNQWINMQEFAETIRDCYHKDYWQTQPEHVEIWLEKDAMAGFVGDVTHPYGIPLYTARGFSSVTFIREAAEALKQIQKPRFIYYMGDHDPSGLEIEEALQKRLRGFGITFGFERIAITLDDVKTYDLKPLEAKSTDSRFKKYTAKHGTETIELDALPPRILRQRIVDAICRHIDQEEWGRLQRVERLEQETIENIVTRHFAA